MKELEKNYKSTLVDLNTLGVPCSSSSATCYVSKTFGDEVVKAAKAFNEKFPNKKFIATNGYRTDDQQTRMCASTKGACAPSCKMSSETHNSNHQLGNAIDVKSTTVGCSKQQPICNTPEFLFLKNFSNKFRNAMGYGTGITPDNIHFSISGK